jgi:hypothetical protein
MKKKYYIITVFACVDVDMVKGPYASYKTMLQSAKKVFVKQADNDAIFWASVSPKGKLEVGTFVSKELEN